MEFVTINYALNQTYRIDKIALQQAINITLEPLHFFRPTSVQILLGKTSDDLVLTIHGLVANTKLLNVAIELLSTSLQATLSNLINTKPKNIALVVTGRF